MKKIGRPRKYPEGSRSQLSIQLPEAVRNDFIDFCKDSCLSQPEMFEFLFNFYKGHNTDIFDATTKCPLCGRDYKTTED